VIADCGLKDGETNLAEAAKAGGEVGKPYPERVTRAGAGDRYLAPSSPGLP